ADDDGWHVAKGHALDFVVGAVGAYSDQTGWRLEHELGHGLAHWHHTRLEQHRRHTDRVAARHGRIVGLLHDHEASVRLRTGRRQDQVAAQARVTAWLTEHALPNVVGVLLQVEALFEHARAWDVQDTADDHAARLTTGVRVHSGDHVRQAHDAKNTRNR